MKKMPVIFFLLIEMLVVAFILSTSASMPENIASHFNGSGAPNAFMSQKGYIIFMLIFAVGIPAIVVSSISIALRSAPNNINIPNKEFWLSPQQKQKTIQFLTGHIAWLGSFIALFIAYVHWLLIKANQTQPAQLSNSLLFIGMGLLLLSIIVWAALLFLKFNKVATK